MSAEHYLGSYSRLLDGYVEAVREKSTASPAEITDRVDAGYGALWCQKLEANQLLALLAIAIDRLARTT